MINKWNNLAKDYEKISPSSANNFPTLPTGAYACEIKGVTLKETSSHKEYIEMMLEITKGEYKDFFTKDYKAQKNDGNKFWRGCFNLWIPADGDEDWKVNQFLQALKSIDVSNPGYTFDGNEQGLKGKKICALFRKEEYIKDGKVRSAVKAFKIVPIEDLENGNIGEIKDKLLDASEKAKYSNTSSSAPAQSTAIPSDFEEVISDGDLPF